ncbi:HlyD family secretion protein [Planctomicrobium sp. SH664]|uniref:HlyD family secretion protein n=1 Tax=Planctomicrobium sp. SH664 TaxID=3448125 RepID=UPI003F5C5F5F
MIAPQRPSSAVVQTCEGPRDVGDFALIAVSPILEWLPMSKKLLAVVLLGLAGTAFAGYQVWQSLQSPLPAGIVSGNGRIEAKLVDIAARESLRVKKILVKEGALVSRDQVLVEMDISTLAAELAEAKASVASAKERVAVNTSSIVRRKSELALAQIEFDRYKKLLDTAAGTQQEFDRRHANLQVQIASLAEDEAKLRTAMQEVEVAEANEAKIQTRIDDATLKSPVRGRVLYRLAEEGEVLSAGGKALTLVNLEDVYMEIFLPAEWASRLKIGAEARVTVDHAPGRAAAGTVSFVSPEAQFTPKQVETKSEREKLMFRVKIQVPEELVSSYIERVKTGVRGVGYVKVDESAQWPAFLQNLVSPPEKLAPVSPSATAADNPNAVPDSPAAGK